MTTHHETNRKKKPHEHVLAAAAADPHADLHETDAQPTAFELQAAQIAFLRKLQFSSAYELAHTSKTAPDVPDAFGATVLATIAGSPELGGKARVDEIQALLAEHQQLTAIATVLGPIARLVGQNLLVRDAKLAQHVGEVLKLANAHKASKPALREGLADAQAWSKRHHPGRGTTHAAPAPTPAPAPMPAAPPPAAQ